MSIDSVGWARAVHEMVHADPDMPEFRLGRYAETWHTDDEALSCLLEMWLEDPVGTKEHDLAARLLRHLLAGNEATVAAHR
ncbi:hypothetical protein [Nocardia brasiliensis]|uniref:hypothetical protein n=1 Tax=Nocardia brasiliensis TaxID=37326 RepID=UPI003D8AB5E1